jgi:hypothetical protein
MRQGSLVRGPSFAGRYVLPDVRSTGAVIHLDLPFLVPMTVQFDSSESGGGTEAEHLAESRRCRLTPLLSAPHRAAFHHKTFGGFCVYSGCVVHLTNL